MTCMECCSISTSTAQLFAWTAFSWTGNRFHIQLKKLGTSSAMLFGSVELVMKRGMLPPASLLVAIRQSTDPSSSSVTSSTDTYLPRTLLFSSPVFSGHDAWTNGMETGVVVSRVLCQLPTVHEGSRAVRR